MTPPNVFYAVSTPNLAGYFAFGKTVPEALARFGIDVFPDTEGDRLLAESYAVVPILHRAVFDGLGGEAPRIDMHDLSVLVSEETHLASYEMGPDHDPATSLSIALLRLARAANEFMDDDGFVAAVGQAEEELRQNILDWVETQPENVDVVRRKLAQSFAWASGNEDWASALVKDVPTPLEMVDVIQDAAVERYRRTANYMMENLTVSAPQPQRSPSP